MPEQQVCKACHQQNVNMDNSPCYCRTPDPRPKMPTPQPGATKRARAASQCSQCETQDMDLQNSPIRHQTRSAYDEIHGMGTPRGTESSERVTHANRVHCCELFCARSSLIVPLLDSSYSSCKLPITKPSFVTNGSRHQSAIYFTLSTSAASSK